MSKIDWFFSVAIFLIVSFAISFFVHLATWRFRPCFQCDRMVYRGELEWRMSPKTGEPCLYVAESNSGD